MIKSLKSDVDEIKDLANKTRADVEAEVLMATSKSAKQVDSLSSRQTQLETKVDKLDNKMDKLDAKMNSIDSKLEAILCIIATGSTGADVKKGENVSKDKCSDIQPRSRNDGGSDDDAAGNDKAGSDGSARLPMVVVQ